MAKMYAFKASDEYALRLSKLGAKSKDIAEKAIYVAAGMVTDKIRSNIEALQTVSEVENIKAYKSGEKSQLSYLQKKGMLDSLGITDIELDDNGFYSAKIGFDGYNEIKTKKYPKGQPNQLIARVVESGSPYMDKMPFMRTAVNATKKPAIEIMQQIIDEESKKIMD